jgi:hypothetical protein
MFGFDPLTIGIGTLVYLAFKKQSGTQFGTVTAEREEVFRNAMSYCEDPQKLIALAEAFRKEGLKAYAAVLRKRAEWRSRTEEKRKEHAAIFERAMASDNASAILGIAAAFEELTATVKANQLRKRVQDLNEQALKKQAETQEAKDKAEKATSAATAAAAKESNGKANAASIPGNTEEKTAIA